MLELKGPVAQALQHGRVVAAALLHALLLGLARHARCCRALQRTGSAVWVDHVLTLRCMWPLLGALCLVMHELNRSVTRLLRNDMCQSDYIVSMPMRVTSMRILHPGFLQTPVMLYKESAPTTLVKRYLAERR
jgi:hypothetical protein